MHSQELTAFGIHGVTPEYIREIPSAGFDRLSSQQLINMRIFNVNSEFASAMTAAGLGNLDSDQLMQLRIFQVTPQYVAEYKQREGSVDYDALVRSRVFESGRRGRRR